MSTIRYPTEHTKLKSEAHKWAEAIEADPRMKGPLKTLIAMGSNYDDLRRAADHWSLANLDIKAESVAGLKLDRFSKREFGRLVTAALLERHSEGPLQLDARSLMDGSATEVIKLSSAQLAVKYDGITSVETPTQGVTR
jgi:hypothetical protein